MTLSPSRIAQAKRDLGLSEDQDMQAIRHLQQRQVLAGRLACGHRAVALRAEPASGLVGSAASIAIAGENE